MPRARFAIGENPQHPGTRTIFSDRTKFRVPVRGGKFTEAEIEKEIERLKAQGIEVGELPKKRKP